MESYFKKKPLIMHNSWIEVSSVRWLATFPEKSLYYLRKFNYMTYEFNYMTYEKITLNM